MLQANAPPAQQRTRILMLADPLGEKRQVGTVLPRFRTVCDPFWESLGKLTGQRAAPRLSTSHAANMEWIAEGGAPKRGRE